MDTDASRSRRRERLIDDPVLDSDGRVIDPGDAYPIDPAKLVPTMLARRELDYLHFLASTLEDRGRVVELGCFLGGSTAAIHAGLAEVATRNLPILVYDAFRAPDESSFEADPMLTHYGIAPGASFRDQYERLHSAYLDRLVIREGLIPEHGSDEQSLALYPENAPIELLFVDAAKSWGVHVSVVRTFVRHLALGGVVVQQDMGDFRTPWVVVHMWQLRAYFEPMDWVRETPTISFRCTSSPHDAAELVDARIDAQDPRKREAMWDRIVLDWTRVLDEDASGWLSAHRGVHALHCADPERAIEHLERAEDWMRSGASAGVYTSPDWVSFLGLLPGYIRQQGADDVIAERVGVLSRASGLRESMPSPAALFRSWTTESMKQLAWRRAAERLIAEDRSEIVLYGAGRHTRWLLGSGLLPEHVRVRCVIDDNAADDSIMGVDVCTPEQWKRLGIERCLVLPSSDAYESELLGRIRSLGDGVQYWLVYTDPSNAELTHDDAAVELGADGSGCAKEAARAVERSDVLEHAAHRDWLGLDTTRSWVEEFVSRYARPLWTRGHISTTDAAFLWDCVEASLGETIVEIGTASGMSALAFALAVECFGVARDGAIVHGFDLTARCYFDPAHRVGDAVREVAPELLSRVALHTGVTSRDAARCFETQSVGLVMIDADHRHPGAALDLLAMLPVLKHGALVILHDIDLDRIRASAGEDAAIEDGPKRLFDAWPYAKTTDQSVTDANIGVLRVADDRVGVTRFLVELIEGA